ncbi:MAG: heparan-alpha-glucosaminide N-acetyltransferase domain-containing protein [Gemmatimonadota bacterium]|nr:heparan-alpha-glucosaminide N-acetyltransferase domain-containing protein [Gemmatimonadota bacterium]
MPSQRLTSIDIARGAVMVLMAIDHVRVYSGITPGGPDPAVFFTRWVTHFCAPAFIFLAGTSAFLYGRTHQDLSRFLVTRGAWLVLLELTVIRVAWTFNFDFGHYLLAGVIWVIGWSMVLLALLVRLPVGVVGGFGIAIIALHNAVMPQLIGALPDGLGWLRKALYVGFFDAPIRLGAGGPPLVVLYTIIPWVGVIAAGYAFGRIMTLEAGRRDRLCLQIGVGATLLFLVLRGTNLYGDPSPWGVVREGRPPMPALLDFLNTSKYPASLSFLLMTLGPTIALLPLLERCRGPVARWLTVFGRVPFFYYMLHIPLIHALALVVSAARLGAVTPWLFANHPMGQPEPPEGYTWTLWQLYLVWAVAVLLLYLPCRWFAALKARRSDRWLSYL